MNKPIYDKRMRQRGVVLPEVLEQKVQELVDEFAMQGVNMNFSSAIRYILEQWFVQREKEDN